MREASEAAEARAATAGREAAEARATAAEAGREAAEARAATAQAGRDSLGQQMFEARQRSTDAEVMQLLGRPVHLPPLGSCLPA